MGLFRNGKWLKSSSHFPSILYNTSDPLGEGPFALPPGLFVGVTYDLHPQEKGSEDILVSSTTLSSSLQLNDPVQRYNPLAPVSVQKPPRPNYMLYKEHPYTRKHWFQLGKVGKDGGEYLSVQSALDLRGLLQEASQREVQTLWEAELYPSCRSLQFLLPRPPTFRKATKSRL